MSLRGWVFVAVVAFLSVAAGSAYAAPETAAPSRSEAASDNEPTIAKLMELLAARKRMASLNPAKAGEQIPWLRLRDGGKSDSSWVLELARPSGVLKKAVFSFVATGDGKGWELLAISFTCAADFAEMSGEMRKRFGKPRAARKGAATWQFRDGWGISLRTSAPGEVEIGGNPNEDVAE